MVSRLEMLKKQKAELLKKAGISKGNLESIRARRAEEKKLKAEIAALKHPESNAVKERLFKAGGRFLRAIKERGTTVVNNIERLEKQRRERDRKEREEERAITLARLKNTKKRTVKKKVKKRTTKKRRR